MNGEYNKFIVSRGKIIDTSTPAVMAIINITPDSFYAGSRKQEEEEIVRSVRKALDDGAAIIDLGAYSTRPGADTVSPDEEMRRMRLALTAVRSAFPDTTVSIDTYRACVAEMAVGEFGADIINDISAGTLDETMFPTMARLQVPYIMMHMRGTPQTMQQMTQYDGCAPSGSTVKLSSTPDSASQRPRSRTSNCLTTSAFSSASKPQYLSAYRARP